jgi:hypothetical protein
MCDNLPPHWNGKETCLSQGKTAAASSTGTVMLLNQFVTEYSAANKT